MEIIVIFGGVVQLMTGGVRPTFLPVQGHTVRYGQIIAIKVVMEYGEDIVNL